MINNIIDAISISISLVFGENYEIYTESVKQGLKEPCFFISCVNPTSRIFLDRRYFRENLFCIQYLSSEGEKETDCNDVVEKLFDCLEYINVDGDLLRGTKMHSELTDGVLNFFVNYNMFVYKFKDEERLNMEELEVSDTDVKGDR